VEVVTRRMQDLTGHVILNCQLPIKGQHPLCKIKNTFF